MELANKAFPPCIITAGPATSEDQTSFDRVFLEATDATLSALGEPVKEALYESLLNKFNLNRETLPEHIAEFAAALDKIFGPTAIVLELRIMRVLHEAIPDFKCYVEEDFSFVQYVEGLRVFFSAPPV